MSRPNWALHELFWDDPGMRVSTRITGLTADSRTVQPGDLFVAYPGLNSHGLDYVERAIEQQAAVIVWQPSDAWDQLRVDRLSAQQSIPFRCYTALSANLGRLADRFFNHPSRHMAVVGVTGTNGKTSCVHFMASVLHQSAPCGMLGTLGNGLYGQTAASQMTTADVVSVHRWMSKMQTDQCAAVVMEVSSHALHQGRVDSVQYNVAILTNISRDHLDYHGDMASYTRVKKQLFQQSNLDAVVINADDPAADEFIAAVRPGVSIITFGLHAAKQTDAQHIWLHDVQLNPNGMNFKIFSSWGEGHISCVLFGVFNVMNLGASLGALLALGMDFDLAIERLQGCITVPGRLAYYHTEGKPHVFVDYAHTPDALAQSLRTLSDHFSGKRLCVFGCGGDRDRGKRALMGAIAEKNAEKIILTDDNPRSEPGDEIVRQILSGVKHSNAIVVERDRAEAIRLAFKYATSEDVILVAGKGHEDYQIVAHERLPFSDAQVVQDCLQ